MVDIPKTFGRHGEELAVDYLKQQGYKILQRNFRTNLGEMDIIAEDKDTICFVEVKARHSPSHGLPFESIPFWKRNRLSRIALMYLKNKGLLNRRARFDVVSVLGGPQEPPKVELLKNAFESSV